MGIRWGTRRRKAVQLPPVITYDAWPTVPHCYTVTDRVGGGRRFIVRKFDAGWAIAPYPPIGHQPTFSTEVHHTRWSAVAHHIARTDFEERGKK